MDKRHILLIMGKNENVASLNLFLESHGFLVTMLKENNHIIKRILHRPAGVSPVDLIIIGTLVPKKLLQDLFVELKKLNIKLPFILISDENNPDLLNWLWDSGFYGSYIECFNLQALIARIELTLKNFRKYQGTVGHLQVET